MIGQAARDVSNMSNMPSPRTGTLQGESFARALISEAKQPRGISLRAAIKRQLQQVIFGLGLGNGFDGFALGAPVAPVILGPGRVDIHVHMLPIGHTPVPWCCTRSSEQARHVRTHHLIHLCSTYKSHGGHDAKKEQVRSYRLAWRKLLHATSTLT